ncbi:unnamed protein product [Rhodiola kirilowii]
MDKPSAKEIKSTTTDRTDDQATPPPKKSNLVYGFLFLHALFIEKGRLETTWSVLRKFGYNNELKITYELSPVLAKKTPDQSVELTSEALEFLKSMFALFDGDQMEEGTDTQEYAGLCTLIISRAVTTQ